MAPVQMVPRSACKSGLVCLGENAVGVVIDNRLLFAERPVDLHGDVAEFLPGKIGNFGKDFGCAHGGSLRATRAQLNSRLSVIPITS